MDPVDAPVTGIKPPPKILAVIEKTAKFVFQYGEKFEERIRKQNSSKSAAEQAKFGFLDSGHVYHLYYKDLLAEKAAAKAKGSDGGDAANGAANNEIGGSSPARAADDTDAARNKRAGVATGGDKLSISATARAALVDTIGQCTREAIEQDRVWAKHLAQQKNEEAAEAATDEAPAVPPPPQLHPPAPMPQGFVERASLLLAAQLAAVGGREAVARAAARAAREAADATGTPADRRKRQRRAELLRISLQQSSPYHPTFRDAASSYSRLLRLPPRARARLEADAKDPWRRIARAGQDSTAAGEAGSSSTAASANPSNPANPANPGGLGVLARAARRGAVRRREAAARDARRQVAAAGWRVDWQDFVVVQTLDDEWEADLPEPQPLRRVGGELAPTGVHDGGGSGGGKGGGGPSSGGGPGAVGMLSQEAMARALAAARRRKALEEAREERAGAAMAGGAGGGESAGGEPASGTTGSGVGDQAGGDEDVDMDMDDDDDDEDDDAMDEDEDGRAAGASKANGKPHTVSTSAAEPAPSSSSSSGVAARVQESLGPSPMEMAGAADEEEIRVIADYAPGAASAAAVRRSAVGTSAGAGVFVDPATGERVPVRGVQEAMRIGLIDQRTYQEQKRRELEKKSTSALVPDEMIGDSLMRMGKQRTDIFGGSEAKAAAEAKAASARAMQTAGGGGVWDGQIASIGTVKQQQEQHGPAGAGAEAGQKRPAELGLGGSSTDAKRPRTGQLAGSLAE